MTLSICYYEPATRVEADALIDECMVMAESEQSAGNREASENWLQYADEIRRAPSFATAATTGAMHG